MMNISKQSMLPDTLLPNDLDGYNALLELAGDIRWCLDNALHNVWEALHADMWFSTRNPWLILQTVAPERIDLVLSNNDFRTKIIGLLEKRNNLLNNPGWFQNTHNDKDLNCVAYFSMEYMLAENIPIYSGGLGNVAGDQLKAAGDIGIPLVGIGLFYRQGYFRQIINPEGKQEMAYPSIDTMQIPIEPVRDVNGAWVRFCVDLADEQVWLNTWQLNVGSVKLYLLDSNDIANSPNNRDITAHLYGGDRETRLKQEIILGIGGWQLIEKLGLNPVVCHLNEGHAAFAVLERAYSYMQKNNQNFDVALEVTRAGNVFTTHTAVPAGFDMFELSLIKKYLGNYATEKLTISIDKLMALGRKKGDDAGEGFNMANLAIRGGGAINGVSALHEKVSQRIFEPVFSRWPENEIPIGHVTNGIHVPTWNAGISETLWSTIFGDELWQGDTNDYSLINEVDKSAIWYWRNTNRKNLVEYINKKISKTTEALLDPDILTIGFARRFATYKRGDLLLHDKTRLQKILNDKKQPIQLILAGKAHPADEIGQGIIKHWVDFIQETNRKWRVLFISDYDMLLAKYLVQGVDVWLNNPRRPWEASGTSGMKILSNGGLNLSILDGWWDEAYNSEVGWAIGDGKEHEGLDDVEANSLYDTLEQKVIPSFYKRNVNDVPEQWVEMMRKSMCQLTPVYSADRTVKEYTEKYYLKAAKMYTERSKNNSLKGMAISHWQSVLSNAWKNVKFIDVVYDTVDGQHLFEVTVNIQGLKPEYVQVQLYANETKSFAIEKITLEPISAAHDADGVLIYKTTVSNHRPGSDYTARIIPHFEDVNIPLEAPYIVWQR